MKIVIIGSIILSIIQSVLFYGKGLGVSVVIFTISLLIYLVGTLYKLEKIENKKALILIVPIMLLSLTYSIFSNYMFSFLNVFAILLLTALMSYLLIKKDGLQNITGVIGKLFRVVFGPLEYIKEPINYIKTKLKWMKKSDEEDKDNAKNSILKGVLISLPIVMIVTMLLSSADEIFANVFGDFIYFFTDNISLHIMRCIFIFLAFIYFASYIYNLVETDSGVNAEEGVAKKRDVNNYIILTIITILNVIYLLFSVIQFSYLFTQIGVAKDFDYATYARSGFFELVFVSVINLILIIISTMNRKSETRRLDIYKKVMNTLLCTFNMILLVSSWYRMYLYEATYGYTTLRLLVYIGIVTEAILLIITIGYIFKEKINLFKCYLVVIICMYVIINYINMDYIIAKRNIDRYFMGEDIDYVYLRYLSPDASRELRRLLESEDDKMNVYIRNHLKDTYDIIEEEYSSWQEFNVSRALTKEVAKDL